ncbi:MAG: SDR family NAD(P)-dependent oxidoreductase [Verrucomicrobia bacterium]|nr:SDR family NAD(P)-dependent oxidoreductase [Verrucomicrobiota bacterium]
MPNPLPTMKGKVVLITGATRGIGRAGAEAMAALGAELILIGRDAKRLGETRATCLARGAAGIRTYQADLSLRKEVVDLAHRITAYEPSLDILWNNAGGWFAERNLTPEGYERTWAMNHLAYLDLTQLLFPLLEKSDDPRVLCTASEAHRWGKMKWDQSPVCGRTRQKPGGFQNPDLCGPSGVGEFRLWGREPRNPLPRISLA